MGEALSGNALADVNTGVAQAGKVLSLDKRAKIDVIDVTDPKANGVNQGRMYASQVTFTEDGSTTLSGSITLPADAILIDILIHNVAVWDDGTSALMDVGDVGDPNGFYTAINLKATDLLAGEGVKFGLSGGKEGADVGGGESAGDHFDRMYLATERVILGKITTGGQDGTAGRTRMIVLWCEPDSIASTNVA